MTTDTLTSPPAAARPGHVAGAAAAMFLVGTLAAVSGVIADYPVYGGQAVRYAAAAVILSVVARAADRGRPPVRLGARGWALLAALSLTGLVIFNVCVIEGTRASGPSLVGIVLGTVPLALAVLGPLASGGARRAPSARLVAAALVVVAGATLATGLGSGSLAGLAWSLGALACEVCFSLLALPLLPALGPIRLSARAAAAAVPFLLVMGAVTDGTGMLRAPTSAEALGLGYLTVVVTVVAFFLWYRSLPRLGPGRAGLFAGMIPVGAMATAAVLGRGVPSAADVAGAVIVIAGILIGLSAPPARAASGTTTGSRRRAPDAARS
ncbi:DMT family transporter [Microbispora sp. ATCC PTA-5024]|uniref:DMT family transporter n=1 Tax=Microbispora sp. ATCC PTA-5024 TaxID=316330 RepID=UPI0003FB951E|nr:DMT family transporter [Microbispora sp. ATCC PTA-5024]